MKRKVLIITSSYDKTCDYLQAKYSNVDFFRFNTDFFNTYSVSYSRRGFLIEDGSGSIIDNDSCMSIYYRKPAVQDLNGIMDDKYHQFVHKECQAFIDGVAESFSGVCLSPPFKMRRADNKLIQAKVAGVIGFVIPEFSISNSNDFTENLGAVCSIVKPLASGYIVKDNVKEVVQTSLYDNDQSNESLSRTPVYFQHYQEKDYEVRITIVDRVPFSVKILSEDKVDWRKFNNKVCYDKIDAPEEIIIKCIKYMSFFDLNFGCFDFIVKNDVWYFLEMNANGQWLWLEIETSLSISKEIMRVLSLE